MSTDLVRYEVSNAVAEIMLGRAPANAASLPIGGAARAGGMTIAISCDMIIAGGHPLSAILTGRRPPAAG